MKRLFVGVVLVAALCFLIPPTLVLAQDEPDTTPPNISAIAAAPADDGTATVSWTTDEPSDSRVDYGTSTTSLDQSASDAARTTSHSLKLTGLQADTTYYYSVSSTDADNNTATSPPSGEQSASFQMPPVPQTWPEVAHILAWLNQEPISWRAGLLFFLGGLTGAAATAFGAVGGLIPGTAGKEEVDRLTRELVATTKRKEAYQAEYEAVRKDPNATDAKRAAVMNDVDRERKEEKDLSTALRSAKLEQYARALPFYLILGGAFASALAQDVLQALAIGAGWPALWAAFRLRPESEALNQANGALKSEKDLVETNLAAKEQQLAAKEQQLAAKEQQNAALTQKIEQVQPSARESQSILASVVNEPERVLGVSPPPEGMNNLGRLHALADQIVRTIST